MITALRGRVLLFFTLAFGLFLFGFRETSPAVKGGAALVLGLLSLLFLLYHLFHGPWRRLPLLAFLPLTLGGLLGLFVCHQHFDLAYDSILAYEGKTEPITAVVETISLQKPYATVGTVQVTKVGERDVDFSLHLELPFACDVAEGDAISLTVTFSLPKENSYGFEERSYYASQGILLVAEASEDAEVTVVGHDDSLSFRLRALSSSLSERLCEFLGDEEGGFAAGILLGARERIGDAVRRDFRYLGISHTLAVSGLHLSILAGGLLLLLRFLRLRPTVVTVLVCLFLLFYIGLTGGSPSVVRAAVMFGLTLCLSHSSRFSDPPTNLAIAALLILLLSPASISDPSFLLSVAATAGLLIFGVPMTTALSRKIGRRKRRSTRLLFYLLSSLFMTYAAILFTLPFLFLYYGEIAPIALFSNLLFLPLTEVALFLSVLALLGSFTPLGSLFGTLTRHFLSFFLRLASLLARFTSDPISLRYPFVPGVLLFGAVLLLLLLCFRKKKLSSFLYVGLAVVLAFGGCCYSYHYSRKDIDTVVCVTLGNNDYLLLHSRSHTLLCDFSDGSYTNLKRAAQLAEMTCCDTSVDTLLFTHLHRKHVTSFARLADGLRLRQLLLPSPQTETERGMVEALIEEAVGRGIEVILYDSQSEARLLFDDCHLTISPLSYLDRSTQPTHLITIDGASTFSYVGSSAAEVYDLTHAYQSEVVFFGTHGPNIKKELPRLPQGCITLVSSEEVNQGYGLSYDAVTDGDGYYRIITLE